METISQILENIPVLLQYYIPGLWAITVFKYFCSKEIRAESQTILTGFVKLNKSDNTELESHKGDNKSMIAIRLADIEYAEIFN